MKRKISILFDKEVNMCNLYFRKFLDNPIDPKSKIERNIMNLEKYDSSEEVDCGDFFIILDINIGEYISGIELYDAQKRLKEILEENVYNEVIKTGRIVFLEDPSEILNKLHIKDDISMYKI